ncbi:MAG TPA: cytochrome c biogenesis protein CcsA [Candidatus Limnocylindrales bacterium]
MATGSYYLYVVAGLLLAFAFVGHVAHSVLLANGRRLAAVLAPRRQPALAGVVTGRFVEGRPGAAARGGEAAADRTAAGPYAIGFAWAAWAALGLALLLRGLVVGRGPWGNMYEFVVAFAFGILLGYLFLERRYPIRSIGFLPLGVALGLFLYSTALPSSIEQLVPALHNPPLLTLHVGMAMVSYGIFATSFAAGVGYLLQGQADRFAWLPSHRVLDEVAYRSVIVGFPIFATMIVLGSYWGSVAWSAWWSWDPKETAALVTWLIYAIYLHARNQRGWSGRPAALILVVGFAMILVTLSGNLWFPGLHSYSGL